MLLAPADPRLAYVAPQPVDRTRPEVRLDRFPPAVSKLLAAQIGPLANLRSSPGCGVHLVTDSPWLELRLERLRHHQPLPQGIALEVEQPDGTWFASESADLRERDGQVTVRLATGLRPGELRTCALWLPPISTCAIGGVAVAPDSQVEAASVPAPRWLAIGDSLTQGFSTQSPLTTWVHRLMRQWRLPAWNLGVGGILIEPEAFRWALDHQRWELVTIALGSNQAWRESTTVDAADRCAVLVEHALAGGHGQIVWSLPPWKPMEDGKGPPEFMGVPLDRETGERVGRVREALRERLRQYPTVQVVEDLLPRDHRAYLDGLHPSAAGFAAFARGFAAQVEPRLLS